MKIFTKEGRRRLSPDFYGNAALFLMATTPFVLWRIYFLATATGDAEILHGGYLWLIGAFIWVSWHCTILGWRGESARRSGFAVDPGTLDFEGR